MSSLTIDSIVDSSFSCLDLSRVFSTLIASFSTFIVSKWLFICLDASLSILTSSYVLFGFRRVILHGLQKGGEFFIHGEGKGCFRYGTVRMRGPHDVYLYCVFTQGQL